MHISEGAAKGLRSEVERAAFDSNPLSGRVEVVHWFQKEYGANWKTKIVDKIMEENPNLNRKSVQRDFQKDKKTGEERWKLSKMTGATREKYAKLGKALPQNSHKKERKPGQGGMMAGVYFAGSIWFSGEEYPKEIETDLNAAQTEALLSGDAEAGWEAILEAYGMNPSSISQLEDVDISSLDITMF